MRYVSEVCGLQPYVSASDPLPSLNSFPFRKGKNAERIYINVTWHMYIYCVEFISIYYWSTEEFSYTVQYRFLKGTGWCYLTSLRGLLSWRRCIDRHLMSVRWNSLFWSSTLNRIPCVHPGGYNFPSEMQRDWHMYHKEPGPSWETIEAQICCANHFNPNILQNTMGHRDHDRWDFWRKDVKFFNSCGLIFHQQDIWFSIADFCTISRL